MTPEQERRRALDDYKWLIQAKTAMADAFDLMDGAKEILAFVLPDQAKDVEKTMDELYQRTMPAVNELQNELEDKVCPPRSKE